MRPEPRRHCSAAEEGKGLGWPAVYDSATTFNFCIGNKNPSLPSARKERRRSFRSRRSSAQPTAEHLAHFRLTPAYESDSLHPGHARIYRAAPALMPGRLAATAGHPPSQELDS